MKHEGRTALGALAVVLALAAPTVAEAKVKPKHAAGPNISAQLKHAQAEIGTLEQRLDALQARLDQTSGPAGAPAPALAAATQAEASADAASAKADQALAAATAAQATAKTAQVAAQTAQTHPTLPKALEWAGNTQIGGLMFFNASSISQHVAGNASAATGTGFDIKRMYLTVDHRFNDTFSGRVVMDISNVIGQTANLNFATPAVTSTSTSTLTGTTVKTTTTSTLTNEALVGRGFYVKNAFLQVKLDPALVIRAGAAPLPWIPYVENVYGFRHIENTTVDRLSYGYTADWGVHVLGDLAGGLFSYQFSAIDGLGYRQVKVTKTVDFEGRVSAQYKGLYAAVGGYIGKRGADVQVVTPTTTQPASGLTAKRFDALAGYKGKLGGIGAEYYYVKNWNNVTATAYIPANYAYGQDAAQGISTFANINLSPKWIVFGRYDWNQPNRLTDPHLRDHYFNAGIQFEPVRIVDVALVFKREVASGGAISTSNGVVGCATSATANEFATQAADTAGICNGRGTYNEVGVWGQFKF